MVSKLNDSRRQRERANLIARLNDAFRQTFVGGAVMMTAGVVALGSQKQALILQAVRGFSDFPPSDDPYGEHDFGALTVCGERLFFKIDYYDPSMTAGSQDPGDPDVTRRVLTIMLASEY